MGDRSPREDFTKPFRPRDIADTTMSSQSSVGSVTGKIRIMRKIRILRILVAAYMLIAFGYFITRTYNDGVDALRKYNAAAMTGCRDNRCATSEGRFIAVKEGCSKNIVSNFFDSLFFPWRIMTDMMPHAIIWLDGYV